MSYRSPRFAALTLAALAAATMPAVAFAQEETPPAPALISEEAEEEAEQVRLGAVGTLSVVDGVYSVETRDGTVYEFSVDAAIRVKQPPTGAADAAALIDGLAVAILLEQVEDGSWIAVQAMIRPDRPFLEHLSGAVVSREGNVITIVDATGREHTVELPEQAASAIEIGETLTAIADRRREGASTPASGRGVVTGDEIWERLQGHVEWIRARAERGEVEASKAEQRIANALARLETNQERVAAVMQRAIERVPEQARARLESARASVQERFEVTRATVRQRFEDTQAQVREARDSAVRERSETAERPEERATTERTEG